MTTEAMREESAAQHTQWAWQLATFFGAGRGRPGPGTWGSVAAVLLWAAAAWGLKGNEDTLLWLLLGGIAAVLVMGVPASTIVARESGLEDPGFVVVDEVAGQWITLLGSHATWQHGLLALVLFRVFDVFKPFPIRLVEKLPEGWGIVFDDVAAGLYALLVATVLHLWI